MSVCARNAAWLCLSPQEQSVFTGTSLFPGLCPHGQYMLSRSLSHSSFNKQHTLFFTTPLVTVCSIRDRFLQEMEKSLKIFFCLVWDPWDLKGL